MTEIQGSCFSVYYTVEKLQCILRVRKGMQKKEVESEVEKRLESEVEKSKVMVM